MKRRKFSELRNAMSQAAQDRAAERTRQMLAAETRFGVFTLGEMQLIKLGLEVLGEQQRVDPALLPAYWTLRDAVARELALRFLPAPPAEPGEQK